MRLRCPHCGKPGNLPDQLRTGTYKVRCRRCEARFAAVSFAPVEALAPTEDLPVVVPPRRQNTAREFGRFSDEDLFDGSDEFGSSEIALGPGDSQYELSAIVDGVADDESHDDLPAIEPPRLEPKQLQPMTVENVTRLETRGGTKQLRPAGDGSALASKPAPDFDRNGRFAGIWSRYQLLATLTFGAVAIAILGFLLLKSSVAGQSLPAATSALIVGLLGTIGFVLLSLTALVQSALLAELARDVRQLHKEFD
jgi:zinc-ribbon domain